MKPLLVPDRITSITTQLQDAGFEAYLVGGCVRDILREKSPKDWDITTNATPEQILEVFPDSFYENDYGTVGVILRENTTVPHETNSTDVPNVPHETQKRQDSTVSRETEDDSVPHETNNHHEIVEITPYRTESKYTNNRHPDEVTFSKNLEDDLKRRDFTMNAIAYDPSQGHIIDPYKGHSDIKDKVIASVGKADDRFGEDALRMMRAVRFSAELDFAISTETQEGVIHNAAKLENISFERIRDELSRILTSENPMGGIVVMHQLGLLKYVIPELEEGIDCEQNGDHIYHVWEHNLRALGHAADRHWPLDIRIAAMLHDVGKPRTRQWSKEKNDYTFYGHDVVGGRMTKKIMKRLHFSGDMVEKVTKLVRYHMFFSDIDQITLSAVRRIVRNVGRENVWDLMKIRACDRIGMGRPKEKPYRLRKYESMIEEAMHAPVTVGMLKIDGKRVMDVTREAPGPRIGLILHALLEEVLEDPELNTVEYLEEKSKEFSELPEEKLRALGLSGKQKQEETEEEEIKKIRNRHHVK